MPSSESSEAVPAGDPFRNAAWFAAQIGMSEDWVRRNVKRLPHHKVGRLTKFDEHCVDLLRERTAVRPRDSMVRTPGSRAQKR